MTNAGKPSVALIKSALTVGLFLLSTGFTAMTDNPDQAVVVTSDVTHFWHAFSEAARVPMASRAAIYQREYFDPGSQGLEDFLAYRHVTLAKFTGHVEANRAYYAQIHPYIDEVVDQTPVIQAAFHRLKALYPEINFPRHVYFVVGAQHGAGMNSAHGIVMAAEMFSTPPGTPYSYNKTYPRALPFIIVHETVHFNQTFQPGDDATLLQDAITEGTADFIASLIMPMPNIRQYADKWKYGCSHETALASRFALDREMRSTGPWMYNEHPEIGWPPDMGYWLGYRIDQSFYAHAHEKRQALRALLEVKDFEALLKASGYPESRGPCAPEQTARAGGTRQVQRGSDSGSP
jgi:Predicted Zn-dependent protease (DUF2268)